MERHELAPYIGENMTKEKPPFTRFDLDCHFCVDFKRRSIVQERKRQKAERARLKRIQRAEAKGK